MKRALCLLLLVACGDDDATPVDAGSDTTDAGVDGLVDAGPYMVPEGCNPLGADWDCLLPFPSDVFLTDDATLPSGRRVELEGPAQLLFRRQPSNILAVHVPDGFSVSGPIMAWFPEVVNDTPLIHHDDDVAATTRGEGPTIVIDTVTGEPVPHFAELDPAELDPTKTALLIRPLVRLDNERRYVVGIRGLDNAEGEGLTPPEGFRHIRDGEAVDPAVVALGTRYETDVFPALESAGFARADLLLAWDFTTGSDERVTGDMLAMREQLLAALETTPSEVTVTEVIDDPEALGEIADDIAFQVEGTLTVPSFLTDPDPDVGRLNRDGEGRVVQNGVVDVPFTILVPKSVAERTAGTPPARLLQYGHGFFGRRSEISNGFADQLADDFEYVIVACDWWGMMREDQLVVADRLSNARVDEVALFVDRTHQGMANFIALARARETIAALPELQIGGEPAFDASEVYFHGNSQGHILGGTYAAISPDVAKWGLGVGGANFSFIMFRSRAFLGLRFLIDANVPEPVDRQKLGGLLQLALDRIDPFTWAPRVFENPPPDAPPRQMVIQVGIGDPAVSSLSAELHARALGIPVVSDSPRIGPLLETTDLPADSALQLFDFGIDEEPSASAPDENEVHEGVRRLDAAQRQLDALFQPDGRVTATCEGVCDPE